MTEALLARFLDDRDSLTEEEFGQLAAELRASSGALARVRGLLVIDDLVSRALNPERAWFERQVELRMRIHEGGDAAGSDTFVQDVLDRAASRRRVLPWPGRAALARGGAVAASLAILAGGFYWTARYPGPVASGSYRLAEGRTIGRGSVLITGPQPARLTLGDYVRIDIEPDSRLRIEGGNRAEAVFLEDGGVLCGVDRGVGSFAVRTTAGDVHVTGTRFSVRLLDVDEDENNKTEGENMMMNQTLARTMAVAVMAGSVMVHAGEAPVPVEAGQKLCVTVCNGKVSVTGPGAENLKVTSSSRCGVVTQAVGTGQCTMRFSTSPGCTISNLSGRTRMTIKTDDGRTVELDGNPCTMGIGELREKLSGVAEVSGHSAVASSDGGNLQVAIMRKKVEDGTVESFVTVTRDGELIADKLPMEEIDTLPADVQQRIRMFDAMKP